MEFEIHELKNGIRLIHKQVKSTVSHCGIIVNTGSRDENENQLGMAHLIEHLIFKGTLRRKAYHILSRMEDVGGELNAYTTKEETCIYTTFFTEHTSRAFELLSDIMFHSSFPVNEIVREKEVIIDEINSYKDSPGEQIFDDFEELIFDGNPLGRNILGNKKMLKRHSRNDILDFYRSHYPTSEMIVSIVSDLPFARVIAYFEKYFSSINEKPRTIKRIPYDFSTYHSLRKMVRKNTHQAHCIMGNQAYHNSSNKRLTLHLLNNLLGGPALNSRLNLSLRERRGFAYNIESHYTAYTDAGIIHIYFGTDKHDINKCIDIVFKELKKLREAKLGPTQLLRAKKQLLGQIAINAENNEHLMITMAKSLLYYDEVDSLQQIKQKIENITAENVLDAANEIFTEEIMSYIVYK